MTTTDTHTRGEELLSLEEAAELLSVSKSTLYRMIEREEVKGRKVGRQWRFRKTDLQAYLERGPQAVVLTAVKSDEVDALLPMLADVAKRMGIALPPHDGLSTIDEKLAACIADLVRLAFAARASDIHLVPEGEASVIRLRIDGVLHELCAIPESLYPAVIGRLKLMAGMNVEERGFPQDGRIQFRDDATHLDARVNVLPTVHGESAVLRLLAQSNLLIGLDQMGFTDDDLARMRRWATASHGLVLFTGPTGSGKTTVLYSCLLLQDAQHANIMTVEDPIEVLFPHIRQVAVNRRTGLTFAAALRAFLRHDPDVIMVGELRDQETAEIAVQAALTGHLVLTTLHVNDATAAPFRLKEMGVEPFLIGGCLLGALNMRLARKVCPHCAEPVALAAEVDAHVRELARRGGYEVPADAVFQHGVGCEHCRQFGYRGRIALFELLECTPAVREALLNGASPDAVTRIAIQDGMRTLVTDGIRKAVDGLTTVDEVLRVVNAG